MSTVKLTVRSVNNKNVTSNEQVFLTEGIKSEVKANQNTNTAVSITEAGDTGAQMASWTLNGVNTSVLYWALRNSGTTRTVTIYNNSDMTVKVAEGSRSGDGTVYLTQKNSSGITGTVAVTYAADDTDNGNTLTIVADPYSTYLGLNGNAQFMYEQPDGRMIKITVDETVDQINTLLGGFEVYSGVVTGVIDCSGAQGAQGTYNIDRADGLGTIDLPDNAIVTRSFLHVTTAFTDAATNARLSVNIPTDDVAGILGATAKGTLTLAANVEGIQTGTAANFSEKTTAARTLTFTVATEDFTDGVAYIVIEYFVSA